MSSPTLRSVAPFEMLWTTDDVAAYLSVAPKTVRKWQLEGRLPFVKLGSAVRYEPDTIRQWVANQAVPERPARHSDVLISAPLPTAGRRKPGRRPRLAEAS